MPSPLLEQYLSVLGLLPKIGNPLTLLTAITGMMHLQAECWLYTPTPVTQDAHL